MLDEFESSARLLPSPDEKKEPVPSSGEQNSAALPKIKAEKAAARKSNDDKIVDRPFRVKLRGSVLVLVRLPNKRSVRGAFHQLSTTGGVIHLEKPLDEKVVVELIFHIQEKTIRNKAQMLFPMWATQGWMQPFRFVDLANESREILDASLKLFLGAASKSAVAGTAS